MALSRCQRHALAETNHDQLNCGCRGGNPFETLYAYNNAGDLSGVDYSDGTADVTHGYNRRGQQATIAQSGGLTTTFTFNDAGAVLNESYSGGVLNGMMVTVLNE